MTGGDAVRGERPWLVRIAGELVFRDWGLKAIALLVAAFLFVFTRDEVTRAFTVPLRVVEDPERVLMTELPETIQVQARGPWSRINRMQDYDFGAATLDLTQARPGPLEIDRAAIVMPSGVVLAGIQYDHVDLRFDPVIEREVEVEPQLEGVPAPDYELVRFDAQPSHVRVRGGESFMRRVPSLVTEPLDVEGADHDVEGRVALEQPPEGVMLAAGVESTVTVRATVVARQDSRLFSVVASVPEGLDPTDAVPRRYDVLVSGPMPDLRVLDGLGLGVPLVARVSKVEGEGDGGGVVEVRFEWSQSVPQDLRGRLELDRALERVPLPAPPPPPDAVEVPPSP
jgi:YbbR domain-containing protein